MYDPEYNNQNDQDVNDLVNNFEAMLRSKRSSYFIDETAFEQILDYYESKDKTNQAMEVANMAITQYPFSATFIVRKAQLLFDNKEFDTALEILDKAEVLDPMDINIFLLRSDIYVWQGKYNKGVKVIKEAISRTDVSEHSDLYLELADIYEEWEKYGKVFESLKMALEVSNDNEEALSRIWFCVEFTEDYNESVIFHKAYIDENPYSHLGWFNLAHAYSGLKDYDRAIEAFEFVFAIDETYDYAYKDCAELLVKIGQYQKAADYFMEALKHTAKPYKELYYSLGQCYEKMNNYNKARYHFRKATNIDPFFEEAFYKIGNNYQKENRFESAIASYERAYKLNDKSSDYSSALALVYRETGDLDRSIKMYQSTVELNPKVKQYWLDLSKTMFDAGDFRGALDALDRAIPLFDDCADILYTKSAYYYQIGNRNESFVNLERAMIQDSKKYELIFAITPYMENDPVINTIIEQYLCK